MDKSWRIVLQSIVQGDLPVSKIIKLLLHAKYLKIKSIFGISSAMGQAEYASLDAKNDLEKDTLFLLMQ